MENVTLSNHGSSNSNTKTDELRIVLVGSAGAGKSATGNSILGAKGFVSKSAPRSVTTQCEKKSCDRDGRCLVLVDTPGFFDPKTPEDDVNRDLRECLDLCRPGPHAIVLVLQAGRFTKEEKESVERIQRVFGKEALKHMVIVFSRKEDLKSQPIKEFIKEAEPQLREITAKCGNRFCAFNNKATGDENTQQVSELIKIIEKMDQQNGECYTFGTCHEHQEAFGSTNRSCLDGWLQEKPTTQDFITGGAGGLAFGIGEEIVSVSYFCSTSMIKGGLVGLFFGILVAVISILYFSKKGMIVGGAVGFVFGKMAYLLVMYICNMGMLIGVEVGLLVVIVVPIHDSTWASMRSHFGRGYRMIVQKLDALTSVK